MCCCLCLSVKRYLHHKAVCDDILIPFYWQGLTQPGLQAKRHLQCFQSERSLLASVHGPAEGKEIGREREIDEREREKEIDERERERKEKKERQRQGKRLRDREKDKTGTVLILKVLHPCVLPAH